MLYSSVLSEGLFVSCMIPLASKTAMAASTSSGMGWLGCTKLDDDWRLVRYNFRAATSEWIWSRVAAVRHNNESNARDIVVAGVISLIR